MILDSQWVTYTLIAGTKQKLSKSTFCKYCINDPNRKITLSQDVREAINWTVKHHNYDQSDIVTYVQYVKQTKAALCISRREKQGMVRTYCLQNIGLSVILNMGKVIGIVPLLKLI